MSNKAIPEGVMTEADTCHDFPLAVVETKVMRLLSKIKGLVNEVEQ